MTILTDCARFEDDLKAYCDGELSWLRRLAVRRHLTRCASCREEIAIMTQIAEDLRAAEAEDALDPTLRAKILGIGEPHPARSSPPSPLRGEGLGATVSTSGQEAEPNNDWPLSAKRGGYGEAGGGVRKHPVPTWAIAGVALIAWFVFFPAFQKVRENARRVSPASAAKEMALKSAQSSDMSYIAPAPAALPARSGQPVNLQVRLSNREAGANSLGTYVQIKDPDSKYADATGNENRVASTAATTPLNGVGIVNMSNGQPPVTILPPTAAEPQRQVHKEASIGVQVPSPEATSDTVETMVKETGGYVASNNLGTGDDGLQSAELIVKVPVTEFETFLSQTAKLGKLQSKSLSGEDITEQTSDADQEESVLEDDTQKSETRLKALGSKAKWHDEQATRDLRIQLAQSRARLVLLKRMAALATITVDLSQTPKALVPVPVTGGFLSGLKATTHDALQSLLSSAGALLALVIWLLAYAPVWIPLLLVGRYALREYRKRQAV